MLKLGDSFEYSPKDVIGCGAFGKVFKGRSIRNKNSEVAIKCVSKHNNPIDYVKREVKIIKKVTKLRHENVVQCFNCLESQNNVYLIMEYCKGGDLGKYLQTNGCLSESTIKLFVRQLADAMTKLSAIGIIHRDLKPQNILLSYTVTYPRPEQITLKIADFGISRFLPRGYKAETICGTPVYMAPEVIDGKPYDAKADSWSLGIIIVQCLTGKIPQNQLNFCAPNGTNVELIDLIGRLLKSNPIERMSCASILSHKFLSKSAPVPNQPNPKDEHIRRPTIRRPTIRRPTIRRLFFPQYSPPVLRRVPGVMPPPIHEIFRPDIVRPVIRRRHSTRLFAMKLLMGHHLFRPGQ